MRHRIVCAVVALCFVLLATLAATHLHVGADGDEACAVCAAVVGKLAGPSPSLAPSASLESSYRVASIAAPRPLLLKFAVLLPPSCGPPDYS